MKLGSRASSPSARRSEATCWARLQSSTVTPGQTRSKMLSLSTSSPWRSNQGHQHLDALGCEVQALAIPPEHALAGVQLEATK